MPASVNAIARAQHGLITTAQARACGLSSEAVAHRVTRGDWRRVRRGLYALTAVKESWHQEVLGGVLVAGVNAFASHATAAVLWGFDRFPLQPIEITVPLGRVMRIAGLRAHRSGTVTDADVRTVDDVPVLSAARTVVDLSARLGEARLARMVDDGLRRGVVTLGGLHAVARRLPGIAPGRSPRVVEAVLAPRTAGFHPGGSELEEKVSRLLVGAGLPAPDRQHRVVVGERVYFLDFAYPAQRIAIEVDGFSFHRDRSAFDRDRRRQNDLVAMGWTVLRFTSTSTEAEILSTVRALVFVR